jgi:hypothetical protein
MARGLLLLLLLLLLFHRRRLLDLLGLEQRKEPIVRATRSRRRADPWRAHNDDRDEIHEIGVVRNFEF